MPFVDPWEKPNFVDPADTKFVDPIENVPKNKTTSSRGSRPVSKQEAWQGMDKLAAARAFVEGQTFGWGDEIGLGVAALAAKTRMELGNYTEAPPLSDIYSNMRKEYSQRQETFAEENPATNLGLNVAGGLLSATPGGKMATESYKGAAKVGAAVGGVSGAGYAPDIENIPLYAAGGAVTGLVATTGIRYMGDKISRALQSSSENNANKILQTFDDAFKERIKTADSIDEVNAIAGKLKEDMGLSEDALVGLMARTGKFSHAAMKFGKNFETADDIAMRQKLAARNGFTGKLGKFYDQVIASTSSRIGELSPTARMRLRKLDYVELTRVDKVFQKTATFWKQYDKLPSKTQSILKRAMMNKQHKVVEEVMERHGMKAGWETTKTVLAQLGEDLKGTYKDLNLIEDFFPRIADVEKLRAALDQETNAAVNKFIAGSKGIVSPERQEAFINQYIRGRISKDSLDRVLGSTKVRTVPWVTKKVEGAYADPKAAFHTYVRKTIRDIEKRKILGRTVDDYEPNLKADWMNGTLSTEGDSIGAIVAEDIQRGAIKHEQVPELLDLFTTRLGIGEQSPWAAIQGAKNIGYTLTLGNPWAATTQFGDLGISGFKNGVARTAQGLFGKRFVNMKDYGFDDALYEEFANTGATAKVLRSALKWPGFRKIDALGKTTHLNAAFRRLRAQANKDPEAFAKKWIPAFGKDTLKVIDEFKRGDITDNVKFALFSELADVQPISLSEQSQAYLRSPNVGRLMYMLKTFTAKQLNLVRDDIVREWQKGNRVLATRKAAKYAGLVTLFNMGAENAKSLMSTGELAPEDISEQAVSALFKNFGASEYIVNKYIKEGKVGKALTEITAPPVNVVDAMLGGALDGKWDEVMKQMPIAGKFYYIWFMDGAEKELEKAQQREMKNDSFYQSLEKE